METVIVVAALIKENDKYLIGLRSTGKYKGFWEFPGGKVENNETYEDALMREISEEFEVEIKIERLLFKIEYNYPDFNLEMHCYLSLAENKSFKLNDHSEIMWFDPKSNQEINWLPADIKVVELLRSVSFQYFR